MRVADAWRKFVDVLPLETHGWLEAPSSYATPPAPHSVAVAEGRPTSARAAAAAPESRRAPRFRALVKRGRSSGSVFESDVIELHDADGRLAATLPPLSPDLPYDQIAATTRWAAPFVELSRPVTSLLVDRDSAWICWEALLGALPGAPPDLVVCRITPRASGPPPSIASVALEDFTAHTLTTDHAGADLGGSAWKSPRSWTYASTPEELVGRMPPGKAQVLHLIGDPIETHAGLRMQFGGGMKGERGRLVSADEASGLLPNTQLAVVQCPAMRRSSRSGVDREKAAYLRSFAAELQARVPTIVTLPALDFTVATDVLRCFDRALRQFGPGSPSMLTAVREARAALDTSGAGMNEAALDICYYGDLS
jgi:hypothetical protein